MIKILVTIPLDHLPKIKSLLESSAEVHYKYFPSKKQLLKIIGNYQVLIPNLSQMIDAKILDKAKKLKLIATPSTGTDHIDIKYAAKKGIIVQSLKKDFHILKNIPSTAELAFCLMLNCLRNVPWAFDAVKKGSWKNLQFRGREAEGRIVGIIGYGRLGSIFSRLAKGFNMQVIAFDPYKKIKDKWVKQVSFKRLLQAAEIITLHVHLDEKTRGLIGRKEFLLMRPGVYLINTSRGAIIDEKELLKNLKNHKIKCAGIDVLTDEIAGDIKHNPLVKYAVKNENLLISPHLGGVTYDAQEKAYAQMAVKVADYLKLIK